MESGRGEGMAQIASPVVSFLCLIVIGSVVVGGAPEHKETVYTDHNLFKFDVSLSDGSGKEEFVCDIGSGVTARNRIYVDLSELNLMEEVVVSNDKIGRSGEFVCWRERQKVGIAASSDVLEDLASQIQTALTYHIRSLSATEADAPPPPTTVPQNGTGKPSKPTEDPSQGKSLPNVTKGSESEKATPPPLTPTVKNGTDTAHTAEKTPLVDDRVDTSKANSSTQQTNEGQDPPTKDTHDPPTVEQESPSKRGKVPPTTEGQERPVDPLDHSGQHQDSDDEKYSVCEDGKRLVTKLQTSGDGQQTLTLSLRNDGDGILDVEIKTPIGIVADPPKLHLKKGDPSTKVNISITDVEATTKKIQTILISSSEGDCAVPISLEVLGVSETQSYFDRFSMPKVVTPELRLGIIFFIMSIVGGVAIWRTWSRWRHTDAAGSAHTYQELEMSLPTSVDTSTAVYGQEKDDKSNQGSGDEEGWDEVWDDWEDTEAARSSSRLIPSLSAKGLAARRTNKDGWENSWDD